MRAAATVVVLSLAAGTAIAQAGKGRFGEWEFRERVDKMTDARICSLHYRKNPRVFYRADSSIVISFYGAGGVGGYRYRVDKAPASQMRLGSQWGRDAIEVSDSDDEFVNGKTALFSGITFVGSTPFEFEVDLRGLREAREYMRAQCNAPEAGEPQPAK